LGCRPNPLDGARCALSFEAAVGVCWRLSPLGKRLAFLKKGNAPHRSILRSAMTVYPQGKE